MNSQAQIRASSRRTIQPRPPASATQFSGSRASTTMMTVSSATTVTARSVSLPVQSSGLAVRSRMNMPGYSENTSSR